MDIRPLFVAFLCWFVVALGRTSAAVTIYDDKDAYEVYSLLLPHEESYGVATATLMIQEQTKPYLSVGTDLTREAWNKFKGAVADFNRLDKKNWLLQRRFQIEKSYKLISSDVIKTLPDQPQSAAALVFMSPVGFNRDKTRAIVYMGSQCGGLCGSARFHLLEKVRGKWMEVSGVVAISVS